MKIEHRVEEWFGEPQGLVALWFLFVIFSFMLAGAAQRYGA